MNYLPVLPWDTMANGKGPTLELCDPSSNNALGENWRHAIVYQSKTPNGDSLWASPLEGCTYLPVAGFTASDTTILLGQSVTFTDVSTGAIDSWYWEFERGIPETFSGQNPPPVTYNIMGSYDVTLTVRNAAGKSVKYKPAYIQIGPAGQRDDLAGKGLLITPNPAPGGKVTVRFPYASEYDITLSATAGTVAGTYRATGNSSVINIGNVPAGIYILAARDLRSGDLHFAKLIIH